MEGWGLFGDEEEEAAPKADDGLAGGAGGVPATEHPYFSHEMDADFGTLTEAAEEFLPTACDLVSADGAEGRALAGALRKASFLLQSGGDATACAEAARRAVARAWWLLQCRPPSEALIHAHAFAHAILAECLTDAQESMRHADLALLLTPDLPIKALHELAARCDEKMRKTGAGPRPLEDGLAWAVPTALPGAPAKVPKLTAEIARAPCGSMAHFLEEHLRKARPVVLEGHLDSARWAAPQRWVDLRYLAANHGHRSIPVELGVRGSDPEHERLAASPEAQGSMLLADFALRFLEPSNRATQPGQPGGPEGEPPDLWSTSSVAYMGQHLLLMQIPELRADLSVPCYCSLGSLKTVNVWMGTVGTVTSLHYDNDDNFLVQVAGFKYVRLYSAEEAERLYATDAPRAMRSHGESFSPVRVEKPDLAAYPDFSLAPYEETILGPGDMLFIPRHVWHYVRSLTTSLSVNFWF